MSQANDLLNSLSGYDTSLATVDPATEPHIIIGSDRFISVPSVLKKIAVQHDNNVETVTFDCPRYWDGLDMSQMVIYINYKRPDGKLGACFATNVTVDAEDTNIMHFDWTITDHITRYKGALIFNVCIKKTDEYNRIVNHWNSELNKEMTISEGLECDVIFEEPTLDVITQLTSRINELETRVTALENQT